MKGQSDVKNLELRMRELFWFKNGRSSCDFQSINKPLLKQGAGAVKYVNTMQFHASLKSHTGVSSLHLLCKGRLSTSV